MAFPGGMEHFKKKGIIFLIHKGVRYTYLSLHGGGEDQWWNTLSGLEEGNEKILVCSLVCDRGEPDVGESFINRAFLRNMQVYPGLPRVYIPVLLRSIKARYAFRDFSDNAQDALLQKTRELDPLFLPLGSWQGLHYVCLRNGLFKTAYWVRKKAVEKAYFDAENCRIGSLVAAFKAGIDQAEFEKARIFLDILRKRNLHSYRDLESYYLLNTGNIGAFRKLKEKMLNSSDQEFMKYIEGKSIALVGPAPSGEQHGEEIDSFDLVVRFNYRGQDTIIDRKEFGKRTDISYYNTIFAKEIFNSKKNPYHELHFGVFKKIEYNSQKQMVESQRARVGLKNKQFFNGLTLAGSHALYDILHFHPHVVKLFNINFYLSKTPYYQGYSEKEFIKYFDRFNFLSFAQHDLVSNINFTRNLWTAGLVEVDSACSEVLRLTTYEYLTALEKLFVQDN